VRYIATKMFVDSKDGSEYGDQGGPVMVAAATEEEAKRQAASLLNVRPDQVQLEPLQYN
jgi:hypothetical protein